MPSYKLTYFNIKGLGEYIRFLLAYMEVEFEDNRIDFKDWPSKKSSTPFGKLPVLEEDGKTLTQSIAIARYLGKKAGLAGNNDWENLQIDIIADTIVDLRLPISSFMMEKNEEVKKSKKSIYIEEMLPNYFKKLDTVVKENHGYLANSKLSWADIVFASISELISYVCDVPDVTSDYPNLHALREKVVNLPQIKKWIEKRPVVPF